MSEPINKNNVDVKIGVIGAGRWGQNIVRTLHALGVLGAVADENPDIHHALTEQYPDVWVFAEHQHLLADEELNAIVIATPAHTHLALAQQVLAAGKHVLIEKPLALPGQNISELQRVAAASDKIVMVGHLLLYQPAISFIKSFIQTGKLGRLLSVHQTRRNLGTVREHENAMVSLGVHDLAVLQYLIGEVPVKCQATGQCVIRDDIEDDVTVHIGYESGVQAHVSVSWLWPQKQRELMILGDQGALHFDEVTQTVTLHRNTVVGKRKEEGSEVVYQGGGQALTLELAHFIDCIITGASPHSDLAQGVVVCELLGSIQRQLEHERKTVPETSVSHY